MNSVSESIDDAHIVLVEDDPSQRLIVGRWLELAGWRVTSFEDAESCLDRIDSLLPDVVCLDLHLPGMDGQEALVKLKAQYPQVPVLVITGDAEVDTVVETMRHGAHDFLVKPVDRTRLETQVRNSVLHGRLALRVAHLEREAGQISYPGFIGTSPPMRRLYRHIDRIAASPVTVLIRGESGSGKELVAQTIHSHSAHSSGPLVAINCAAIPESLQESELFGHEKGAFTGADGKKIGRFEEADGGTLFLDEVAELSASLQAKLLRVLQERTFRRLGGRKDLSSRFRLIAASHANLNELVENGVFRQDLYYRLAVFELDVPPLRERLEDLPALAAHFLADTRLMGEGPPLTLSPEALDLLSSYPWPGNVRELANALQRAVVVAVGERIRPQDMPPRLRQAAAASGAWNRADSAELAASAGRDEDPLAPSVPVAARGQGGALSETSPTRSVSARSSLGDSAMDFWAQGPTLEEVETVAICRALERHDANVSAVARELGIGRNTLYRKIEKYGIRPEDEVGRESGDVGLDS